MKEKQDIKISELLTQAKSFIESEDKWIKGDYSEEKENKTKCYCSVGAVHAAMAQNTLCVDSKTGWTKFVGATYLLKKAIIRNHEYFLSINRFNDHPETTHADIMKVFDTAIMLAKSTGN